MRFVVTADPINVRHIFTSNHANYPKGQEFADIFDIMRGSIFTVDGEACGQQRAMFQSVLSNPPLLGLMASCCRVKVVNSFLPFLSRMASTSTPFNMQDLVTRLLFDLTATPIFERKLAMAHKVLNGFIREMTEKWKARCATDLDVAAVIYILSADPVYSDDFLLKEGIDTVNFMVAGRDTIGTTLPWVFYNLSKNPRVVSCIHKELAPIASLKATAVASNGASDDMVVFDPEETKDLVYLKAALFESLRLYLPGPFECKVVLADDVLPSGHQLRSGETIVISIYAMGRMEALWGKDCHEYRPERWLSEDGAKLRYVPSYKFMAFNSGPRTCLGKDTAIAQMTIVAALVWNFDMEVLQGHSIQQKLSCVLQLKNGLVMMVKQTGM
ncbi:Alkane hydroxylase MAH1 [Dichanthelium oligosanthes]|uniref:Alkane hydroxylase MAH1 n=1 Tax=Dichanthelium oligosanthes TaxID=888268 RepID=A0A1E5V852_9POAL|nr:Alkane hydroxylase MAH1 [Dichanthelium oligosanthes]